MSVLRSLISNNLSRTKFESIVTSKTHIGSLSSYLQVFAFKQYHFHHKYILNSCNLVGLYSDSHFSSISKSSDNLFIKSDSSIQFRSFTTRL